VLLRQFFFIDLTTKEGEEGRRGRDGTQQEQQELGVCLRTCELATEKKKKRERMRRLRGGLQRQEGARRREKTRAARGPISKKHRSKLVSSPPFVKGDFYKSF
jgi:hypothetical protein